jgi:uncharacterized protein (DUF2235 family)
MQRLAVFLDGTWNDAASKTNVSALHGLVATTGTDGAAQSSTYIPGVGTKWYQRITGGAVGEGLSQNVIDAYKWLQQRYNWDANPEDQIFIFGFSRGAYTARSLAGLIATCGLAHIDAPFSVHWLYERYRNRKDTAVPIWKLEYLRTTGERPLTGDEQLLLAHSKRVDIHMIGVWDTVGALGIPWTGMPLIGKQAFYFHNPNLSVIHKHAFQALAIDEQRGAFKPTLWTTFVPDPPPGQPPSIAAAVPLERCEQRWFVGAHSDVGGGSGSTLPQRPLQWLQEKAQALGLGFSQTVTVSADALHAKPEDSYAKFMFGVYRVLKLGMRFYRPIGINHNPVKGGQSYPVNETLDASVFDYCRANPDYKSKNLAEWQQKRGGETLDQCQGVQVAQLSPSA